MRAIEVSKIIQVPDDVEVTLEGKTVTVKGVRGTLTRDFSQAPISMELQGKSIRVWADWPRKKDKTVLIENFTGERNPRRAKIIGDAKVKVSSEDIIVQGINLEDVSQTAANIEQATKVKRKDPRIFLDGIYLYERSEGMEQ